MKLSMSLGEDMRITLGGFSGFDEKNLIGGFPETNFVQPPFIFTSKVPPYLSSYLNGKQVG